ncbi:hypothetical protein B0I72DRAFT_22472 [Yarrowia lipolytica]|jgi:hypothetical protein|nr:Hypothetical protein YALI2_F00733g [Yarrowia lipolytica]RDW33982.1 hypothetical protein B0I72DRAFT_22472 [Yarrowia lipolytica]RDW41238.1 hypothetical protein B0I73DRAFT_94176 [Yarrowia lipolytica]SEI32198.1 YALIA101S02e11848g1_1 [Yarrowia lipolytica]
MYDFLVLPEFSESDLDLGYDHSNVANAFPEQLTDSIGGNTFAGLLDTDVRERGSNENDTNMFGVTSLDSAPVALDSAPVATDSVPTSATTTSSTDFFPYYTYDSSAMAIDDVVFPAMLSPSMSSEGTSPTLMSSDSLFDQSYDFDKSQTGGGVTQSQSGGVTQNHGVTQNQSHNSKDKDLELDSFMPMSLRQPLHVSPLQTSPLQTSPLQTSPLQTSPIACQPTPVHSRSQSYSLPYDPAPALINGNHTQQSHNHVAGGHHSHNHNHNHNVGHSHNVASNNPSPDSSECESDDDEEELSLDDSPSAHGVLFKNLSQDEQTKYRKYHCPVCKKYFRRDLPRHLRIHQRVARFVCPYPRDQCSHKRGQFNRPYDYKKHLLHSHFQFDEAKLVRGFRDLKSKLSHYGTCNCGRRFRADKWLDDHVMKCLKEMN